MTRGQAILVIAMAAIAILTIGVAGPRYGFVMLAFVAAAALLIVRWQGRSRG